MIGRSGERGSVISVLAARNDDDDDDDDEEECRKFWVLCGFVVGYCKFWLLWM